MGPWSSLLEPTRLPPGRPKVAHFTAVDDQAGSFGWLVMLNSGHLVPMHRQRAESAVFGGAELPKASPTTRVQLAVGCSPPSGGATQQPLSEAVLTWWA